MACVRNAEPGEEFANDFFVVLNAMMRDTRGLEEAVERLRSDITRAVAPRIGQDCSRIVSDKVFVPSRALEMAYSIWPVEVGPIVQLLR